MYSGELEDKAKRKALAVLQDEINRILNSARELSALSTSLIKGDDKDMQASLERMRTAERRSRESWPKLPAKLQKSEA